MWDDHWTDKTGVRKYIKKINETHETSLEVHVESKSMINKVMLGRWVNSRQSLKGNNRHSIRHMKTRKTVSRIRKRDTVSERTFFNS